MPLPHGGKLVNRTLDQRLAEDILADSESMKTIGISAEMARDCENIATGVFSPLTGFVGSDDLENILDHMRLANDTPWTIPIILDIDEKIRASISGESQVALRNGDRTIAILDIDEIYKVDRREFAEKVFGTNDPQHPGVAKAHKMGTNAVSGDILLVDKIESVFPNYHLIPRETRILFKEKGWRTIVGFQTRNVPHIGHEYLQKTSLSFTDGLLINPVIGKKKPGDFEDEVIISTYESLIKNYYLKQRAVLVTLQFEMRYAGPREAILHSIVRKNYGCTHFIVGRDHAGVGSFYPPFAAQEIFDEFPDLGISPLFFRSFFHCNRCNGVANEKTCPHPEEDHVTFSGTKIRDMLTNGEHPPKEIMRPEIAEIVLKWENPFVA